MVKKLSVLTIVIQLSAVCFGELDKQVLPDGIEFGVGVTNIYQHNARGGLSTHRRAGRFSGSYDLEMSIDTEKIFGWENGAFFMLAEGSWSKSGGINDPSVGSIFGVNADGAPRRSMDITELWYEHSFWDNTLLIRIGKIDLTCGFECRGCPVAFDRSMFANDETSQFLNGALVNNPTIPFGDNGLGIAAHFSPDDFWYLSAAVKDAQSDVRETGFRTAFHGEDYFFYILETGIMPQFNSNNGALQGAYRIGVWYDPQPKANSDRADDGRYRRDDRGFYISCDQMLYKENADEKDSQGLGVFFRYGYAPSKTNDITQFVSFGFSYQGLFEGRDEDVLGVGFAHGTLSDSAKNTYNNDYESAVEVFYNAKITHYLNLSPSIQYITNPGGVDSVKDAVIFGLRAQLTF
ncbi:MAG: carbohydrate porin [Phycisphaerae bacterium]